MSSAQGAEMEMDKDRERLNVAKRLRIDRGSCCCLKVEAAWYQQWGKPLHTLSPTDLFCRRGECSYLSFNRPRQNERLRPCSDAELKLFFPRPQELGIDPSRPPEQWLPTMLKAANDRRRACFNLFADRPPSAPLQMPAPPAVADDVVLPHDLLLFSVVLPHLPLPDVFRARVVCQLWHQTLSSPLHLRCLNANPDFNYPRLIMQTSTSSHQSCLAIFDQDHWLPNPIPLPPFCLRAAAGGLLCFSFEAAMGCWKDNMLLVGNPLTQRWRRLPPLPGPNGFSRDVACAMWADPLQGCYKIFVLCVMVLYIYDSLSNKWKSQTRELPFFKRTRFCRRECSVTSFGLLHQLSLDGQVVFSYDMEKRSSSYVKTYGPSDMDMFQLKQPYSRLPALAYCNGRVFVVARTKAETIISGSRIPWVLHGPVAVWELHDAAFGDMGKWGWPVSVAPQDFLEGAVKGSDGTDFCVTTDGDKTIYLVLSGGATMLVYDVISGVWSSLPGCPPAFRIGFHQQPYYVPLLWLGPV